MNVDTFFRNLPADESATQFRCRYDDDDDDDDRDADSTPLPDWEWREHLYETQHS